jgi:hypothetical protein
MEDPKRNLTFSGGITPEQQQAVNVCIIIALVSFVLALLFWTKLFLSVSASATIIGIAIYAYVSAKQPVTVFCPYCEKLIENTWVCGYCDTVNTLSLRESCAKCGKRAGGFICNHCHQESTLNGGRPATPPNYVAPIVPPTPDYRAKLQEQWDKKKIGIAFHLDKLRDIKQFHRDEQAKLDAMKDTLGEDYERMTANLRDYIFNVISRE